MKMMGLVGLAALLLTGCATETHHASGPPPGPSLVQVQSMVNAHVSDSVIINQIQTSSTRYLLTADQIIALKNAGVSEAVINALINTASKPQPAPPVTTTTVVQPPYAYP